MRLKDPRARVAAYLDDTYLAATPEATLLGLEALRAELERLGLKLKPGKTHVWAAGAVLQLPPELARDRAAELKAVGSTLNYATARGRARTGGTSLWTSLSDRGRTARS